MCSVELILLYLHNDNNYAVFDRLRIGLLWPLHLYLIIDYNKVKKITVTSSFIIRITVCSFQQQFCQFCSLWYADGFTPPRNWRVTLRNFSWLSHGTHSRTGLRYTPRGPHSCAFDTGVLGRDLNFATLFLGEIWQKSVTLFLGGFSFEGCF